MSDMKPEHSHEPSTTQRNNQQEKESGRYSFLVEWFDPHPQLVRQYTLTFFAMDNSFEMYDLKSKKLFLKRTGFPSVGIRDLQIGNYVTLFSRQLLIKDVADRVTEERFSGSSETALMICSASVFPWAGKIINYLQDNDCRIHRLRTFIIEEHGTRPSDKFRVGKSLVIEISRRSVFKFLAKACSPGDEDSINVAVNMPRDIQYQIYHSATDLEVRADTERMFGTTASHPRTTMLQNSTLCLVRPHAVSNGQAGQIIDQILSNGYEITDIEMVHLSKIDAEEFLEVYKGVLPHHQKLVDQMSSGPLIAINHVGLKKREIINGKKSIVQDFRLFVGPSDPVTAKRVAPNSLRAMFGSDEINNAIHCTDLPDDALLELEYFFSILVNQK